jgi:hypothetical protein
MWRLAILLMLAGCELRGLTRGQLYGPGADAGVQPVDAEETPDTTDARLAGDTGAPDRAPDGPVAPPEGIFVTGFVAGLCNGESVPVGGAGFHTCSFPGKSSYRLRIRNIPPGTRVEIGARQPGYLPDPATAVITLELDGNIENFQLHPAGDCTTVPDAGPCVCNAAEGCEPS